MRKDEGMYVKVPGYLAQGDLASLFTARVTRLYLNTAKSNNRYGWVLPGSALINQVWQNWRSGSLNDETFMHHERAWSLDGITPPVFEHAPNGTCVVVGRKERTQSDLDLIVEHWEGSFDTATIREEQQLIEAKPSYYLDAVERGCFFGPYHLFHC